MRDYLQVNSHGSFHERVILSQSWKDGCDSYVQILERGWVDDGAE